MWRLVKVLMVLAVLAVIGFVAFAYLGPVFLADDFAPQAREVTEPVDLDLE